MLHEEATLIADLPGPIVDLDVSPGADWVAVCQKEERFLAGSRAAFFPLPPDFRFPLVRSMDNDRLLIIDTRTIKGRANALVVTRHGRELHRFCAGDAVADALVAADRIVVTYFDEGVFGSVPPSAEGVALFSFTGELAFGYQSGVADPVDVADCYCACLETADRLWFFPYTGFQLVRLDLRTLQQGVRESPESLFGASALSTDGRTFWLWSPYSQKRALLRWQPGNQPLHVGDHPGPLGGLPGARFLSVGHSGYTIVSEEAAQQAVGRDEARDG